MLRRCPTCHQLVDDNRLVACPRCHAILCAPTQAPALPQEQLSQLADRLARPVAWVILKRWWFWAGFCSLLITLLGASYVSIRAKVEEVVTSHIAQRFAEPRIRETFQEVANTTARELLLNKIQPAVDRFRADLQNEYQAVSEEIKSLKLQSNLPFLGDKAIKHDDREAFEEIIRITRTAPEDSPLKKFAIDEVRRFINQVGGQWITGEFVSTSLLGKSGSLPKDDTQIPTDQLMVSLSDPDFKVRARAAMLLGNRREKGVPHGLLQVARTDRHLLATYYAIVSFGFITRRMNRPISAGQEPIGISQLIEMFDIDKLEQWWKDHSAEVNERLADMK